MKLPRLLSRPLVLAALLGASISAQAAPILYNTGVNNAGTPQADNATELHFTLVGYSASYVATSSGGYPIGPWLGDNTTSAWIAPTRDTYGNYYETYHYRTTFTLTAIEATTFTLSGRWAADDQGTDLKLNGVSTGNTAAGFTAWTNFNLNSGFIAGLNSLDFFVLNSGGGPTGLRVEFDYTNSHGVPDSGSVAWLTLAGLISLAAGRRFRR